MTDAQLYSALLSLSPDLKKDVEEFLESMRSRTKPTILKRQLGCAKGLIELGPNFEEPLDDFPDYI